MADKSIEKGGYLQFDASTIEQYIKDRLNANPNTQFTDHNFEGSYFSSLIEVVSYVFNVLMFYLNQTSTESKFTDAQLYENMNRIVKLLGYNPIGYQTSIVPFTISESLDAGLYVIPRYSYVNAGGTTYSFNQDISFRGGEASSLIGNVLYQGKFYEYPVYTALGLTNEIVFLTPGDNIIIDHFNIDVYVKSKSGIWEQWERTDSLVTKKSTDKCYEVRLNENKRYELKFGNGINGTSLVSQDSVAIYYLQSDGAGNELSVDSSGIGDLNGVSYIQFASSTFTTILSDLWATNPKTIAPAGEISLNNTAPSTAFAEAEAVESIRTNTPDSVKRKLTISKTTDYERVVTTKFSNFISDVKVMNNFDYIKNYLDYFRLLGITGANSVSRILYNQIQFADSCNFNNMYIFLKPKIYEGSPEDHNKFLPVALKQLILNEFENLKQPTVEPVIMDPVYMAIGFGINNPTEDVSKDDITNSQLVVIKDKKSLRNNDIIKQDVNDVILEYFNQDNCTFSMYLDFPALSEKILGVNGVVDFRIQRIGEGETYYYGGLSLIVYNPVYTSDVELVLRSETLQDFQVPYLVGRSTFIDKISVVVE